MWRVSCLHLPLDDRSYKRLSEGAAFGCAADAVRAAHGGHGRRAQGVSGGHQISGVHPSRLRRLRQAGAGRQQGPQGTHRVPFGRMRVATFSGILHVSGNRCCCA